MRSDEVKAIREGSAVLARPEVRTLEIRGPDRVRFLNGMVSNDVASLRPGQGTIALKTSNKGRIEAVVRVRAKQDALLIDLRDVVAERLRKTLEAFIIMDDCTVTDVSPAREVVSLLGPKARDAVALAGELEAHAFVEQGGITIIRDLMLGLDGFEIHTPHGTAAAQIEALAARGAERISAEALDVARIEAGTPIDGRDIDEDTIPMEARLERALSLEKGCYVGQEVIARATNFGQVKHILVGLRIDGDVLPEEGAPLVLPETENRVGEITSVARSPAAGGLIALGYVKRAQEQAGTRLSIASALGRVHASVVELPFAR